MHHTDGCGPDYSPGYSNAATARAATPATVSCDEPSIEPAPMTMGEVVAGAPVEVGRKPVDPTEVVAPVATATPAVVVLLQPTVEVTVPMTRETVMVLVLVVVEETTVVCAQTRKGSSRAAVMVEAEICIATDPKVCTANAIQCASLLMYV